MLFNKLSKGISLAISPVLACAFVLASVGEAQAGCSDKIAAKDAGKAQDSAPGDIIDTAVGAGKFTTLAKALGAAGLVETLKGKGPFTVFAPDDAAFAKVPADALNALIADKAKLTKVLTYHVVNGEVLAKKVVKLKSAKTLEGSSVAIKQADGAVMVDDAKVTATDIKCSNGVIHVIDKVLMPQ
ncbi:MAG: fasciclin domain-containing protein [Leptolyngbya sp.]|nr:fasciclin domain-containing protein [Candidatus Melainabacteria bacterium]